MYATSDIVVMPSQEPEHCPAVPAEAAIAGRPLLATAIGATPEMVGHGQTGFLVEPTSMASRVHHARLLVDDADLRRRMGEAARQSALEQFWHRPLADIHETYASLLAKAKR